MGLCMGRPYKLTVVDVICGVTCPTYISFSTFFVRVMNLNGTDRRTHERQFY